MECMELKCDGLFLNAGAGFDVSDFRRLCDERSIIHNIDINKRRRKGVSENYSCLNDSNLYKKRFSVE